MKGVLNLSTSWEEVYTVFFDKIEKDLDFFSYTNLSPEDALTIALSRSKKYLKEAISKLTLNCSPDINFYDYDETNEIFNEDLTHVEIDLLASIMREKYFEKDLVLLKAFQVNFSPKDLAIFSPANERKTFTDMVKEISTNVNNDISKYDSLDRITGKPKRIDYSQYSSE